MEQLMISLPGINRHHNSPTLLAYYEARDDFEEYIDRHFQSEFDDDSIDGSIVEQIWMEDMFNTIGVPFKKDANKAKRAKLELWIARYREAIALLKESKGNLSLLYYVKDTIE